MNITKKLKNTRILQDWHQQKFFSDKKRIKTG